MSAPISYCLLGSALCQSSSEWAAWMQAVGSLVALLIAIAVPVAMDRFRASNEEKLRREAAKNAAIALLPVIQELSRKALNFVEQMEPQDGLELEKLDGDVLTIIPEILTAVPYLDRMGSLADELRLLVLDLLEYQRWDRAIEDVLTARYNNHMRRTEQPAMIEWVTKIGEMAGKVETSLSNLIRSG